MMRRKLWSHWDTKSCMIYKKEWFIPPVFLWLQSCYKIYKDSILVSLVWEKCQLVYVLMDPCDSSKLITNFYTQTHHLELEIMINQSNVAHWCRILTWQKSCFAQVNHWDWELALHVDGVNYFVWFWFCFVCYFPWIFLVCFLVCLLFFLIFCFCFVVGLFMCLFVHLFYFVVYLLAVYI